VGLLFLGTGEFAGVLEVVRSGTAYTKDEVRRILQTAKDEKLDIIPLVQTFGHLEWILKYEQFAKYRQNKRYPQVEFVYG
jgi:hexosaminidase